MNYCDAEIGAAPSWTWRAAAAASCITLGLFLALPFLDTLTSKRDSATVMVRTIETRPLPPAPAPPRPAHQPEQRRQNRPLPTPQLREPKQWRAPLGLLKPNLDAGDLAADLAIEFPMAAPAAVPAQTAFEMADLDTQPVPIAQQQPFYPPHARAGGIQGHVILEFVVGIDGRTSNARVIASDPAGVFVAAALLAVERWRFKPGLKAGRPVPVRVRQKLTFRLE